MVVGQQRSRPDIGGQLIFGHTNPAVSEVRRRFDPIPAHINRSVTKGARDERRYADVRTVARRRLDGETRERKLADVEIFTSKRPKKDLLGAKRHDDRAYPVDLDAAVEQRTGAVVVSDCNRQLKFGHEQYRSRGGMQIKVLDRRRG